MVDLLHDRGRLIANYFGEAEVLVGSEGMGISGRRTRYLETLFAGKRIGLLNGRHVENAVAKGPEDDRRVTDIRLVGEHDLENGDVLNDRRGDGGDEEENGRYEDQRHTDPISASDVSCVKVAN